MILKRIITTATLLSLWSAVLFTPTTAPLVFAQESTASLFCPMTDAINVDVAAPLGFVSDQSQTLVGSVTVTNSSDYTFADIGVGVAIYENELDETPLYWTTLSERASLLPGRFKVVSAEIDASSLPAGTYLYKIFAAQGDALNILGAGLLEQQNSEFYTFDKNSIRNGVIEQSVVINGKAAADEITLASKANAQIQVQTKNNSTSLVPEGTVSVVLTEGNVPLGVAVVSEVADKTMLIPGGVRSTELPARLTAGGQHSVYTTFSLADSLQPLTLTKINIPNSSSREGITYLSSVGFSEYPITNNTKMVACLEVFGFDQQPFLPPQETAAQFAVYSQEGDLLSEHVVRSIDEMRPYVYELAANNLPLKFSLRTTLYENAYGASSTDAGEDVVATWKRAQQIDQAVDCEIFDKCADVIIETVPEFVADKTVRQSFWFYAGIVIAALLLMFIVTRRLDPHEDSLSQKQPPSPDELQ